MVFEVSHFVRQQEGVRHELVVDWKESLQARDDHAEDVLLCEVVHQRVSVENALAHLDDVEVVVAKSHPVPKQSSIARLSGFSISVLTNDVLESIQFSSAVVRVDDNLSPSELRLFLSVHDVIVVHSSFLPLLILLLRSRMSLLVRAVHVLPTH